MGYLYMIRDMFSEDLLVMPNPEKTPAVVSDPPPIEKPEISHLQGRFAKLRRDALYKP